MTPIVIIEPRSYYLALKLITKYDCVIPYSGKGYNVNHNFQIKSKNKKYILELKWVCATGRYFGSKFREV